MGRWQVLREPAVPILLLACVVHVVRRNLFDLLLFGGTAVLIVVDAWRAPGAAIQGARRHRRAAAWRNGVAVSAFAALVAPLPRSGVLVQIVLAAVGFGLLAVLLLRPGPMREGNWGPGAQPGGSRAPRRSGAPARSGPVRGWPVWAALAVVACLWELTSFALEQADPAADAAHPTMSDLIGPLLDTWPGRLVFLALWGAGQPRSTGHGAADGVDDRHPHHAGSGGPA